jgi:hypothetical protein
MITMMKKQSVFYFVLVDTNENYFNCGHYSEWEVAKVNEPLPNVTTREGRMGRRIQFAFATRREAENEAARLNEASRRRWREFLAC